eukprot:CAMPEP_0184691616 /NCGR_PEP_ID=MMETSP0313-20130426/414_1 /TAXON_ID=2792 /ORGANISM="Porphyridium aerugineum, Strain SAG 1380-2" /LENGTH=102 /DNA_ID=CAMNT_0027149365 /DNA_START=80 /DNA_END=388 /DNA_ORIENTATION=+
MAFIGVSTASSFGLTSAARTSSTSASTICMAHHVEHKHVKKYNHRRPKKHTLSDINRAEPKYEVDIIRAMSEANKLPPVYTIQVEKNKELPKVERKPVNVRK